MKNKKYKNQITDNKLVKSIKYFDQKPTINNQEEYILVESLLTS